MPHLYNFSFSALHLWIMECLLFRLKKEKKEVNVKFSLDWTNFTKCFDFDTDMSPVTMADGIAREKWSRDYFDNLKKSVL